MITIDDKLFVTKEMADVMVTYTQKIILKKFLMDLSFDNKGGELKLTNLLQNLNYYNGDTPDGDDYFTLCALATKLIDDSNEIDRTALYFWVLNHNYMTYFNESETENDEGGTFEERFGRELASKMYEPNVSGLKSDLEELLYSVGLMFSSEFDFSEIDESTISSVLKAVDNYGARY